MLQRCRLEINKDNTYSVQVHPQGRFVLYADILPLLREARWVARRTARDNWPTQSQEDLKDLNRVKAFLAATAAIEEEKGVEG